jgi:hypothetical protein
MVGSDTQVQFETSGSSNPKDTWAAGIVDGGGRGGKRKGEPVFVSMGDSVLLVPTLLGRMCSQCFHSAHGQAGIGRDSQRGGTR